jgi:hypothetical protein
MKTFACLLALGLTGCGQAPVTDSEFTNIKDVKEAARLLGPPVKDEKGWVHYDGRVRKAGGGTWRRARLRYDPAGEVVVVDISDD